MKNFLNVFFVLLTFSFHSFGQLSVPNDWYFGNPDGTYNGISINKVYAEFLKNKTPKSIIVGVIDSGIDIDHEDLKDNIWINPGEIPANGIDDDKNGYVDDVHGWNFLGGPDGQNVAQDSYEATRVFASLRYKYGNANPATLNKNQKKEYDDYVKAKEIIEKETNKAKMNLSQLEMVEQKVMSAMDELAKSIIGKPFDKTTLDSVNTDGNYLLTLAKNLSVEYLADPNISSISDIKSIISEEIAHDKKDPSNKVNYSYNPDFDPRKTIVKDNYADPYEKYYGNSDVKGPDPLHGTHVGGIIGAIRNNGLGNDGIVPNVKLMPVRAVPDGDERDKDVANAIRYAVDNGASVINMSFGKGFSPDKNVVDEAVRYAAKKDVLIIHAAGNAGDNNDSTPTYPNDTFEKKSGFLCKKNKKATNWVTVGALNYKKGVNAIAPFSNYGLTEVDLFSPGMMIYSTTPNDGYAPLQGTSMAAPVVAGVAATIRSVYPSLTAEQVKDILINSVTKVNEEVMVPGSSGDKVPFSKLCVSGGIVNMYKALQYAANVKGKKKMKEVKA
jgi:cell wall-associated protease